MSEVERYKPRLRGLNIGVAVVHTLSFIALLIISLIYNAKAERARLWTDYDGLNLIEIANYPLYGTLLPFPIITAAFHLAAVFDADKYYEGVVMRGLNRLRWIEYAITNSLITISLLTLVGAGNVYLVVAGILSNIVMQYFGYLHEWYNHNRKITKTTLMFIVVGFFPFIAIWLPTIAYTIANIKVVRAAEIVAVFGSLVLALLFVLPLLIRYMTAGYGLRVKENVNMEIFYCLLSLTAKLFLDWTITIDTILKP
jgi:hypothetical protein